MSRKRSSARLRLHLGQNCVRSSPEGFYSSLFDVRFGPKAQSFARSVIISARSWCRSGANLLTKACDAAPPDPKRSGRSTEPGTGIFDRPSGDGPANRDGTTTDGVAALVYVDMGRQTCSVGSLGGGLGHLAQNLGGRAPKKTRKISPRDGELRSSHPFGACPISP